MTHEGVSHLFITLFLKEGCCLHFPHFNPLFKTFFQTSFKNCKAASLEPCKTCPAEKKAAKKPSLTLQIPPFLFSWLGPGDLQGRPRHRAASTATPPPGKRHGVHGVPTNASAPTGMERGNLGARAAPSNLGSPNSVPGFHPITKPGLPCCGDGAGSALPVGPQDEPPQATGAGSPPGTQSQTSATLSPAAWGWTMGASTQNTYHKERVSGAPAGTWYPISPLFPTQNNLTFRSRVNFIKFFREKGQKSIKEKSSYFGH